MDPLFALSLSNVNPAHDIAGCRLTRRRASGSVTGLSCVWTRSKYNEPQRHAHPATRQPFDLHDRLYPIVYNLRILVESRRGVLSRGRNPLHNSLEWADNGGKTLSAGLDLGAASHEQIPVAIKEAVGCSTSACVNAGLAMGHETIQPLNRGVCRWYVQCVRGGRDGNEAHPVSV